MPFHDALLFRFSAHSSSVTENFGICPIVFLCGLSNHWPFSSLTSSSSSDLPALFHCHSFTMDLNITWNFSFSEIATTDNWPSGHVLPSSFQLTHFPPPLSFLPIHQQLLSWVSSYPEYIAHIVNSLDPWSFHWSYLAKPQSWMNPLSVCSNFFLVFNSHPFTVSR